MPKVKLTTKAVESAKPPAPGQRLELFDASLPGFGLRVGDSNKSWFVFYRFAGKQKRLTIGHFPSIGLGEARDRAAKALQSVEVGIDPAVKKLADKIEKQSAAERKSATGYAPGSFGEIATLYIKQECPLLRRGREVESIINREILARWKDRAAVDLRRKDLVSLLDPIVSAGHAQKAHRVRGLALRIVNWSVDRGDLEANLLASPSRGRRRGGAIQRNGRDRVLAADEIRDIWLACDDLKGPFPGLVRVLMLTGQRRDEVSGMRWCELDLDAGLWTIPSERYKTGVVHAVPLTQTARDIIASQPRVSDKFVFTTAPDSGFSGYSWAKTVLDKKVKERRASRGLEDMQPWRLHDLRRTLRTGLSELRVGGDVAERVIGHVIGGVRGVYDRHAYMDEKRDALERWGAKVMGLVDPSPDDHLTGASVARKVET
ncbi:site-specific integrase [Azospirillum cavernae]|uniref:Site-specific integrase n=1 Tax=Azospirillum cavernae TaxID=2320860 RepID=A0A418VWX8_9PROT|nr:site-specific integrase [Azospirillum cavernae]RJF81635.1 site-specific integrase [Azospirillum cavernae]